MTKTNSRPTGKLALLAVLGLFSTVSSPVLADPAVSATRISIDTHDIDLASPAGIEKLHGRVNSAIRSACASTEFGGTTDYAMHDETKAQSDCLTAAHAAAAPKVQKLIANGNPKVAAN